MTPLRPIQSEMPHTERDDVEKRAQKEREGSRGKLSEPRRIPQARQRFKTTSRTTFPLGPNGFCGLPLSSALTPPALPRVTENWS